jgi:hypothetical protein
LTGALVAQGRGLDFRPGVYYQLHRVADINQGTLIGG